MRVDIFKLCREEKEWVIDEKHPIAVVTVKGGQGSFRNPERIDQPCY